jgi:hypothetical protein
MQFLTPLFLLALRQFSFACFDLLDFMSEFDLLAICRRNGDTAESFQTFSGLAWLNFFNSVPPILENLKIAASELANASNTAFRRIETLPGASFPQSSRAIGQPINWKYAGLSFGLVVAPKCPRSLKCGASQPWSSHRQIAMLRWLYGNAARFPDDQTWRDASSLWCVIIRVSPLA